MARELSAKVASVISETTIAINVGGDDGVSQGDTVIVWRSVDVKDPDTGDVLGTVRLQNLRLKVNDVQPRFSLARVEATSPLGSFGNMFKPSKVIASTQRVLDQEQVRLTTGDDVTVIINDSFLQFETDDEAGEGDIPSE